MPASPTRCPTYPHLRLKRARLRMGMPRIGHCSVRGLCDLGAGGVAWARLPRMPLTRHRPTTRARAGPLLRRRWNNLPIIPQIRRSISHAPPSCSCSCWRPCQGRGRPSTPDRTSRVNGGGNVRLASAVPVVVLMLLLWLLWVQCQGPPPAQAEVLDHGLPGADPARRGQRCQEEEQRQLLPGAPGGRPPHNATDPLVSRLVLVGLPRRLGALCSSSRPSRHAVRQPPA